MTENEILRATTGTRPPATSLSAMRGFSAPDSPESDGDVGDAGGAVGGNGEDGGSRGSGERVGKKEALGPGGAAIMLSSYALWDYIVEHPLVRGGQIDISDACDRLRRLAKPGRNGPVFPEEEVKRAIEGSRRGGGDALI
jgi:Transcription factor PAP1